MSFPWLSMLPLTPFMSLVLCHFMIATTGNWLSLWCLASLCISLKVSPLQSPFSYFTPRDQDLAFPLWLFSHLCYLLRRELSSSHTKGRQVDTTGLSATIEIQHLNVSIKEEYRSGTW